jgi:hypothetical protein
MSRETLVNRLVEMRRLRTATPTEAELTAAVAAMQLDLGGRVSDSEAYTWDLLNAPRCGCAENMANGVSKWTIREVSVFLDTLPRLSPADWKAIYRDVFDCIASVCGLSFVLVEDTRQARQRVTAATIDGPGRVLADQTLPFGQDTLQRLDAAEDWGKTAAQRHISGFGVALHETLHCCGLDHIPASVGVAVINPIYNPNLLDLQPLDIEQLVMRYGKRTPIPTPPGPFAPTPGKTFTIANIASVDGLQISDSTGAKYRVMKTT